MQCCQCACVRACVRACACRCVARGTLVPYVGYKPATADIHCEQRRAISYFLDALEVTASLQAKANNRRQSGELEDTRVCVCVLVQVTSHILHTLRVSRDFE